MERKHWQQFTAVVTLGVTGGAAGIQFVHKDAAQLRSPSDVTLTSFERPSSVSPDHALRHSVVNVARQWLRLAQSRSPAEMEAMIWNQVSTDHADHGPSCAAFASLALELGAQNVGQQSWVHTGSTAPWPMHSWGELRVDENAASPWIKSVVQGSAAAHRWHPLGDGYRARPGDWVLFNEHVEVVTRVSPAGVATIGADSAPDLSVNAHWYPAPVASQGVAGFVDNGPVSAPPVAKTVAAPAVVVNTPAIPGVGGVVARPHHRHPEASPAGVLAPVIPGIVTPVEHHPKPKPPPPVVALAAKPRVPHAAVAWLQAERQQETGYPAGNYNQNSAGCAGAYCWSTTEIWQNMARHAGVNVARYPNANDAPPHVQDHVAWAVMAPYVTRGHFAQAAEVWNGGHPYPVPNPALGSSGVYANEVIQKFHQVTREHRPAKRLHPVSPVHRAHRKVSPPVVAAPPVVAPVVPGLPVSPPAPVPVVTPPAPVPSQPVAPAPVSPSPLPPAPSTPVAPVPSQSPVKARLYRGDVPVGVQNQIVRHARAPIRQNLPIYKGVAGEAAIAWELLAVADWLQCKSRRRFSPVFGERLGTVNGDGTVYDTREDALFRCAQDLTVLPYKVYGVDITDPRPLTVVGASKVFASFRWGGILRQHRVPATLFPYAMEGLTADHEGMRWPDADGLVPDKPGSKFGQKFGALALLLHLGYPLSE